MSQLNAEHRLFINGDLVDADSGATYDLINPGGGTPKHLKKGYFIEPTLFADVDNSMTIAQEEIFGPVLVVIPFDNDDDAVRIANDSIYGLSGSVISASPSRAMRVARRIRTGSMNVNGAFFFSSNAPFGGYKQSGLGRENGVEGFEEYLEAKTIAVPTDFPRLVG